MTVRITDFLDFALYLIFRMTLAWNLDMFIMSSDEMVRGAYSLRLIRAVRNYLMEMDRVSKTLCPSEYYTMDRIQKVSNPGCCTPLSKTFGTNMAAIG